MSKNIFIVVLLVVATMMLTACPKNTTSTTTTTTTTTAATTIENSIYGAAQAVDVIANALVTADNINNALLTGGQLSQEEHDAIKASLKVVASKNLAAITLIKIAEAGNTSVDWKTAVVTVAQSVVQINPASFNIKNPTAAVEFTSVANLISGTATAILNTFGGK